MAGGAQKGSRSGAVRQAAIVLLLVGAVVLLHRFAVTTGVLDPTAMLAFGFVVLASYAIGQIVDVVRLPHITGYLLAGMIFGPSVAAMLPPWAAIAPFDRGLLNEDVAGQLAIFDTLAVALIAMTAGGELKIDALRRGFRAIMGVLIGQTAAIVVLLTAFVWVVAGGVPQLTLPGLADLPTAAVLPVGAVLGSIGVATSPAATIAVVNSVSADGPMTRTVLSTVVLKDVVVVVGFSVASVWAAGALGTGAPEADLGKFLLAHVGGSLVVGGLLGVVLALYLRYVGREVVLFIMGVVYATTLLSDSIGLETAIVFIAAGFTTSNFSREGDQLIQNVERLSMPIYVVFFTLAGATLHIDDVVRLAPFAVTLVLVRILALRIGVGLGARVGGADPATRRYGWLGFVSQAGVALMLAAIVGSKLGAVGASLETLIIAGIAINELLGPVLLKVGLGLAGESEAARDEAPTVSDTPPEPKDPAPALEQWPEPQDATSEWGQPTASSSPELGRLKAELRSDLHGLVRELERGALERFRTEADRYLQELRREFLRHHRRIVVHLRDCETPAALGPVLHAEQSSLSERWRGLIIGRGARLSQRAFKPTQLIDAIDRIVESLPESQQAPYEPESFLPRQGEAPWTVARRTWLRSRRAVRRLVGQEMAPRHVRLRELARYHLSGLTPARLEGLAALFVQAEVHLVARTRNLFDGIVFGHDQIVARLGEETFEPAVALAELRTDVERELGLAFDEVGRIAADGSARVARVLGEGIRDIEEDLPSIGTLDLPNRRRRTSRLFKRRMRAVELLQATLSDLYRSLAASYSLLGLELELVGLEARIKDVLSEHLTALESDIRGRAHVQAERAADALSVALAHIEDELFTQRHTGEATAATLRQLTDPLMRVIAEAARTSTQLRDQLADERTVAPLLDALQRSTQSLTDRYGVPAGRLVRGEWKLATPVPVVEVPFRDLVTAHIETVVAPKLIAATRQLATKVQPLSNSLMELDRMVAFNVELASAELELVHDESVPDRTRDLLKEMVLGAFERSREIVQGHARVSAAWPGELRDEARAAVLGGIEQLRAELVDGELSVLRVEMMRRTAAGRQLIKRAGALPTLIARIETLGRRTVKVLLGSERMEGWRRVMGLPSRRRLTPPGPADFAPPRPLATLPLLYGRLFATETLEAGDVLTGRDDEMQRVRAALGGEGPGRLRAVALVGDDGVGKGAVASAIVRAEGWKHVKRLALTEPASVQSVDEWFRDRVENHVFVLSGFHWLIAMRPGGLDPLRRLVDRVISDGGRNVFLLSADTLVWDFAKQAAPIGDAFPEVVLLAPLTPPELEAAVLARHGLSGFGLSFEPHAIDSRLERAFAAGAGRIRRPYEHFFQSLHVTSGGLVRDALRLWLASVDAVDEDGDFVHIGPVPPSPLSALRHLPEEVLLTLYQIARQGWMDAHVQSYLFRVDQTTAEAQLARLAHIGILARKQGRYRIHPHLRGPIHRVLRETGWVS